MGIQKSSPVVSIVERSEPKLLRPTPSYLSAKVSRISIFDMLSGQRRATRDEQRETIFMRNKPNLQNALIFVTSVIGNDYEDKRLRDHRENKPNQTQTNPISSPLNHADFSSKTSFTKLILHSKFYILNSLLYCSPVCGHNTFNFLLPSALLSTALLSTFFEPKAQRSTISEQSRISDEKTNFVPKNHPEFP